MWYNINTRISWTVTESIERTEDTPDTHDIHTMAHLLNYSNDDSELYDTSKKIFVWIWLLLRHVNLSIDILIIKLQQIIISIDVLQLDRPDLIQTLPNFSTIIKLLDDWN